MLHYEQDYFILNPVEQILIGEHCPYPIPKTQAARIKIIARAAAIGAVAGDANNFFEKYELYGGDLIEVFAQYKREKSHSGRIHDLIDEIDAL
jgi:hypothetical protein